MTSLHVGITLPALGDLKRFGVGTGSAAARLAVAARHVEDLGFESVWTADLIIGDGTPAIEAVVTLTTAAAVTERVRVGFGVLVLPLRPVVWTAAQIASLQHLSGNRVLLGIGSGGFPGSPFWRAAGVPGRERGALTDMALDVLPRLISGQPTILAGDESPLVTLAPPAEVPPILVGGNSGTAMRRSVTRGFGWFPSLLTPETLRARLVKLREMTGRDGLPQPEITVGGHAMAGKENATQPARAEFARRLVDVHRLPAGEAANVPLYGTPGQIAERLASYAAAGASRVVLGLDGDDWMHQCELLAEARTMLG
jgi:alkanesulfonate monooxygenase SsuD/methylene tetrahydromethanopterin reductase-like flavin-dependent oxidoreductase (luciferase family)